MELSLIVPGKSNAHGMIKVSEVAFGREFNEALVHQVVTAYLSGARAGTHAQKNRAAVSGGGSKPWRQKGTGRARAGTIRSPLWRKGGVTFAAKTQDYSQKVNRSMYRGAMRAIVSELIRQNRLIVIESFQIDSPKTRGLVSKLKELNLKQALIVTDAVDENLYLAARNLLGVGVLEVGGIDPVSLIKYEKVLMTAPAIKQLEEMLS